MRVAKLPQRAKSGKKNRKHGRNLIWCKAYRSRRQREKNKVKRLRKHMLRHPADHVAAECLSVCKAII